MNKAAPPFAVHYLPRSALPGWLLQGENILGTVAYGLPELDPLSSDLRYTTAPLTPISGEPVLEVWTALAPVRPLQFGTVCGAFNDQLAFGVTALREQDGLEVATERAYLEIFAFLEAVGNKSPVRFWNYPVAITGDDNGMERYRRFNIGRYRAFSARLQQRLPPVASAVGGHAGDSIIYFLASTSAALPVENPRQVSAFDYPRIYGPRSPSFSRASIYTENTESCLFVSGTASIVGHETRHAANLTSQIAETAENLRAIIGAAEKSSKAPLQGEWALKIYLSDPAAQPEVAQAVDAVFGAGAQQLYLRGDICRKELLVEVEAFRQF